MISYTKAYRLTLERIQALEAEEVPLVAAVGRITARDLLGCPRDLERESNSFRSASGMLRDILVCLDIEHLERGLRT